MFNSFIQGFGSRLWSRHIAPASFSERDCSSVCDVIYLSSVWGLWKRGAGGQPARKGGWENLSKQKWVWAESEFPRPLPDHPALHGRRWKLHPPPYWSEPRLPDKRTQFWSACRFLRNLLTLPWPFPFRMQCFCYFIVLRHTTLWSVRMPQDRSSVEII